MLVSFYNLGYTNSWEWTATTLNPYYEGNNLSEMIADDRFICDTLDHWDFGPDNTGNIMSVENVTALKQRVEAAGPVQMVLQTLMFDEQFICYVLLYSTLGIEF